MKAAQKVILTLTLVSAFLIVHFAPHAQAGDHGRGTLGRELLDFKSVTDARILRINEELYERVMRIDFSGVPELKDLSAELLTPILEMTAGAHKNPNQYPGDWRDGGILYGYTDLIPGAPTMIFPVAWQPVEQGGLSDVQIRQLLTHEALHRALPNPLNGLESLVSSLTRIIALYAEDRVVRATQPLLQRYAKLEPRFAIQVLQPPKPEPNTSRDADPNPKYKMWVLRGQTAQLPGNVKALRVDKLLNLEAVGERDLVSRVNGFSIKVKNRIHLDFTPENVVSRFAVSIDISNVDYKAHLYGVRSYEVVSQEELLKKLVIDGSAINLISGGSLNIRIRDSFAPDRMQAIRVSLDDVADVLSVASPSLDGSETSFQVSDFEDTVRRGYYWDKYDTKVATEIVTYQNLEELRKVRQKQLDLIEQKIQQALKAYFEAVDYDQPIF